VQAVGKERRTVHEEGRRAGEATTQLVGGREAIAEPLPRRLTLEDYKLRLVR
jgi:hypothetical protein